MLIRRLVSARRRLDLAETALRDMKEHGFYPKPKLLEMVSSSDVNVASRTDDDSGR